MASELRVNTLKDASGNNSIATSFVAGGSAKAWVNFNGTGTPAIRDSLNFSSITDSGTGNGDTNFTNSFASIDFCDLRRGDDSTNGFIQLADMSSNTTSKCSFQSRSSSFVLGDCADQVTVVHGDLA
jgi:hypothetical protein